MIDIAFIWHMHQPYYKSDIDGLFMLPWVRLHGVKDYYPMAAIVEKFDNVRVTFNMVPVLVEQIRDYVENNASDTLLELTLKKPGGLTLSERVQILDSFFKVNFARFIEPHPRYRDLLIKKGVNATSHSALRRSSVQFSNQDYLDLQVLFNLAWFHSLTIEADSYLRELVDKKEGYTEAEKMFVVKKQKDVLAEILPLYRRLQDAGRIEITTTPYYHPILPLLCDTDIAKVSAPDTALPSMKFSHPEDARWHLEQAVRTHAANFGKKPCGMWPSEGSVSEDALGLIMGAGIEWVATDEDILFLTLNAYDKTYMGKALDRRLVYQPYRFHKDGRHLTLVFRDKNLSNLISFAYASWDPQMAALDLVGHFQRIEANMRRAADRALVPIVMDGENAWEYYEDNGRRFFELLYSRLDGGEEIASTTVSEYLRAEPAKKSLKKVFPGSWIDHCFKVWIGAPQDHAAWERLVKTRADLVRFAKESNSWSPKASSQVEKAWRELYIAEGSDWTWWYGPENKPGPRNPFDTLFRAHLQNIYRIFKKPIPDYLKEPIG